MLCFEFNIGSTYAQNDNNIAQPFGSLKLCPIWKNVLILITMDYYVNRTELLKKIRIKEFAKMCLFTYSMHFIVIFNST